MSERALPTPFGGRPMPDAGGHGRTGLHRGLLLWVVAGHAGAVWLAQSEAAAPPPEDSPRLLRVRWLAAPAADDRPTPAAPPRAQPATRSGPPSAARTIPEQTEPEPRPVQPPAPVAESAPAEDPVPIPSRPEPESAQSPVLEPVAPTPAPRPAAAAAIAAPEPPVEPPSFHADYLANPAPDYPPLSRRTGEQGTVRLRVQVSAAGLPLDIQMDTSSGHPRLDRAAREAVAGWRFLPARRGGRAVAGWVLVPISFALRR